MVPPCKFCILKNSNSNTAESEVVFLDDIEGTGIIDEEHIVSVENFPIFVSVGIVTSPATGDEIVVLDPSEFELASLDSVIHIAVN